MHWQLSEIAKILNAKQIGDDTDINGISIDSKTTKQGDLFVALKGEKADGHAYIKAAKKAGAAACLISQPVDVDLPTIQVPDTLVGLQSFAAYHRDQFSIPVIAITGSCGKTTTRELTAAILREKGDVLSPEKNYNNHIGVPLTLLKMHESHQYAVIEMGANHMGEIADYCCWAKPNVSAITMVGEVHLEGFGSIENIASGKSEIYNNLPADGMAVINNDDAYADVFRKYANGHSIVTFGIDKDADVMAHDIRTQADKTFFTLQYQNASTLIELPLPGKHNVYNALLAISIALIMDCNFSEIQSGLSHFNHVSGRLAVKQGKSQSIVIDDTYNANVDAAKAAMDVLMQYAGKRYFIFGDMGEIGNDCQKHHQAVGSYAKSVGVDKILTVGEFTLDTAKAAGDIGQHFQSKESLVNFLLPLLDEDTVVLVKGSRTAKMEDIVHAITA